MVSTKLGLGSTRFYLVLPFFFFLPRMSIGFVGFYWVCVVRQTWIEFYRVLPSFTEFSLASVGFTVFQVMLPSFTWLPWVLPNITEFCGVLPGFTLFFRVLPSFP